MILKHHMVLLSLPGTNKDVQLSFDCYVIRPICTVLRQKKTQNITMHKCLMWMIVVGLIQVKTTQNQVINKFRSG
jgi:hypothetical protein